MEFFTSDYHLQHKKIIEYCKRPFKSVYEMTEAIVDNHNKVVRANDILYHLGDFAMGSPKWIEDIIKKLNGNIVFIRGCHDKNLLKIYKDIPYMKEISCHGQIITLSHYAMRTWPKSHYNSWALYGHSHNGLKGAGKSFDVGVDTCHLSVHAPFTPYSFDEVKEIMDSLPDNFNYVNKRKV